MPNFKKHLDRHEFWKAARITLKGQDETGNWVTAQAKEYPKRLSLAIANAMIEAALGPPITHTEHEVEKTLLSMQPYAPQRTEREQAYGIDYVDNILPVCHLKARWISNFDMHMQAQVSFLA